MLGDVGSSKVDMSPASGNPVQALSFWHTILYISDQNSEDNGFNTYRCSWCLPNPPYIHKGCCHLAGAGVRHLPTNRILCTYDEKIRSSDKGHSKDAYEVSSNRFQPIPMDIYIDHHIHYTRHTGHKWMLAACSWNMADTWLESRCQNVTEMMVFKTCKVVTCLKEHFGSCFPVRYSNPRSNDTHLRQICMVRSRLSYW